MREWRYAIRRTVNSFIRVGSIDAAASLTFFSALSLFPAALTFLSFLALLNGKSDAVGFIINVADGVFPDSTVESLRKPLQQLEQINEPGVALVIGLILSVWSVSAYATSFGRNLNAIYAVQEGRRIWKFRGLMMALTLLLMVGFASVAALALLTPAITRSIGQTIGVGDPWVTLFDVLKWPVILIILALLIAALYYWTPNVAREKVSWVSYGAVVALIGWVLSTLGFALYVSSVGHYAEIYGWLGGAIVLLLWLFLSNLVLIVGATFDAEVVRVRQLRSGIESEVIIKIPMRDTTRNLAIAKRKATAEAVGRAIREEADAERHARSRHLAEPE